MKLQIIRLIVIWLFGGLAGLQTLQAQDDDSQPSEPVKSKPVKSTFESTWIIDNQSVMVPSKGTLQMDIMHRFGTIQNGYDDLWGIYAPANIRIGMSYVPMDKLVVGFGLTKINLTWDFNAKYALIKQMNSGGSPISLTYFGNFAVDTRDASNFANSTDRLSYFNQLIIARKVTKNFSVQASPSISHFNAVEGYIDSEGNVQSALNNDHVAVSFSGRYKLTPGTVLMANYDQPLTKHKNNNPNPNIAFGLEFNTSAHAFQVFFSNYYNIVPQLNNMYNNNNYADGEFLIGFNITRLWGL